MGTILPTRRLPLRNGFVRFKINRSSEVLVFVIHVQAAALRIDGVAFGPTFKCQLFFLVQGLAVQNTDTVVAWCCNPDLFCGRHIDDAVGCGIDVATSLARESLFINSAYAGVGPVTDIYDAVANRYATRPLSAFATIDFEFLCRKARNLADTAVAGVHHIDR